MFVCICLWYVGVVLNLSVFVFLCVCSFVFYYALLLCVLCLFAVRAVFVSLNLMLIKAMLHFLQKSMAGLTTCFFGGDEGEVHFI